MGQRGLLPGPCPKQGSSHAECFYILSVLNVRLSKPTSTVPNTHFNDSCIVPRMEKISVSRTPICRLGRDYGCTARGSLIAWYQSRFSDINAIDFDLQVRQSLAENDHTVVSIFVNPAQFAPHEDLATYPRTLAKDVELLSAESLDKPGHPEPSTVSVVFAPNIHEMYPSGISQDASLQKGTFVQVKGYDHQMEGKARPTFFGGVATVVTKLFNIIEVCQLATNYLQILSLVPPIANECLFWSKGYSTSSSPSPALRRPAFLPSRSGPRTHHPNGP